jgi:DNA-binding Lrp family transcriptional regulator
VSYVSPQLAAVLRERVIGDLSLDFLVDVAGVGVADLDSADALLVMAINQANILPLTQDPGARRRYGDLSAPAPDNERRPVSISAMALSLGLPFETARRHVHRLAAQGVCAIEDRGVIVPAAFLSSPAYLASVMQAYARLRTFHDDLRSLGLLRPLPAPAFPTEGEGLMRGAARLVSDYLLRVAAGVVRVAGDRMSALALLGAAAGGTEAPTLTGDGQVRPGVRRPVRPAELARRLRLPAETTRRQLLRLVEEGVVARTDLGFMVTEEMLASRPWRAVLKANAADVQRLFDGLAVRGVIALWDD